MSNTTYSLVRPTRGLDADPESDLDLDAGPGASSGPRPVSASAAGRAPARDPGSADPTGLAGPARPDGSDGSAERAVLVGLDTSSATGWDVEESWRSWHAWLTPPEALSWAESSSGSRSRIPPTLSVLERQRRSR